MVVFAPITAATTRSMPSVSACASAVRAAAAGSRSRTFLCQGARGRRSTPTIREVMSSLAGGDRGGEAVAAHPLADRGGVGRASPGGAENRRDLLEIARSEEAGRRHGKELRVVCAAVLERMNCPAR